MTPQARAALESAQEILHRALVAYAKDEATLDYVTDGRAAYSCLVADGHILLAVCDPPVSVAGLSREH
jgi:hypothetical protein